MRRLTGPLGLAVVITLANAIKPVLIDDTAYLVFARHLAAHPLDPYDFTLHWYTYPDRAFDVLLPPVLPYWLALGIGIFGEHIVLLKLWLFPILWCFTVSLNVLLRRFARGAEGYALPLIALSPAVLPTVNFMLDIPAAALALAAVAVFTRRSALRSEDSASRLNGRALAAGLLAGIAMQTKYTAMLAPAAILWYGITHRRIGGAILACIVSAAVFAGWEAFLFQKYGESHFLHHLAEQSSESINWLFEKSSLMPGLFGHSALLGFGIALVAARLQGLSNRWTILVAAVWCVATGFFSIAGIAYVKPSSVWRAIGFLVLASAIASATSLVWKRKCPRHSRDSRFLAGWLLIEMAGYFALTPFPAGRRVIGLAIVFGLVTARLLSRIRRARPERTPGRWMLPFAIWISLCYAVLDTVDANAEKVLAERAAHELHGEKRVWFAGHWGFQFYCERAGFKMVVPGETVFQPGDRLVMPTRTHIGNVKIVTRKTIDTSRDSRDHVFHREAEFDAGHWAIPGTIPDFYGGNEPISPPPDARDQMRITIYRVLKPYAVPAR